jgi:hypothetical protein
LLHFLRLDLPPDMAAFILASFDLISVLACAAAEEEEEGREEAEAEGRAGGKR